MSIKRDLGRYTTRPVQDKALEYIKNVMDKKRDNKFFLMNLPTGSGKSHLAMMIADYYISNINKNAKIDIITPGKLLQDQYSEEYESINDLKGKENYSCKTYDCSCAQGMEFNKLNKTSCDFCPYKDARLNYINGKISLTNFHLYLIYKVYAKDGNTQERESNVLIVDESHEFDDIMSDFISIKITEASVKKLKYNNEKEIINALKKVRTINDYIFFLKYLRDESVSTMESMEKSMMGGRNINMDKRDLTIGSIIDSNDNKDVKIMKMITDMSQQILKIDLFTTEYSADPDNWVLEANINEKTGQKELSLEPIWAYDYLDKYVWSKYDKVFLMSGTILDKNLFCELNGIDVKKTVYYSVPSPFPLAHRPLYYLPVGKMSYNKKEETFEKYKPWVTKLLKKYKDKKGIIHTNSFELSNWFKDGVLDERLVYHDSSNKEEILKYHFDSDKPSVLVSPSVGTGVSFDYDRARFQIIAKIPYPSLASQKNKLRQKNNPRWYSWKTCTSILQFYGRVVRSKTDKGDTIIIDESFSDILRYSSDLLPIWFQQAIKTLPVK